MASPRIQRESWSLRLTIITTKDGDSSRQTKKITSSTLSGLFEARTVLLAERLEAARDALASVAPHAEAKAGTEAALTFELIQHRFTARGKKIILEVFPRTKLDLDEEKRRYRYGKFGYSKYVYPKEAEAEMQLGHVASKHLHASVVACSAK